MSKRKIYYSISVFFIVLFSIAIVNVRAHPPEDMQLAYDSNTNTISVIIVHGVSDNTTHYIASVQVKVNGSTDQTHYYSSQPSLFDFTYQYTVITNNGSIIEVTAICSVSGSLTKTLGGTTNGDVGIPGYIGFIFVLIVSVITLLVFFRKRMQRS
ncbi:MAG: hypothetical protein ACFE96_10990 [Candidatus Hermodarchaeota archaeon]